MKKRTVLIPGLLILAVGIFLFLPSSKNPVRIEDQNLNKPIKNIQKNSNNTNAPQTSVSQSNAQKPLANKKRALLASQKIVTSLNPQNDISEIDGQSLAQRLKSLGLAPQITKNTNKYTGTMKVIRSRINLPGTRYVHAQFFTGAQSKEYLQHFSFEIEPGNKRFEEAKRLIQNSFELTTPPSYNSGEFISWEKGPYTIWIKKLNLQDLSEPHPFNAYSEKDLGSIRVAIELNIHKAN